MIRLIKIGIATTIIALLVISAPVTAIEFHPGSGYYQNPQAVNQVQQALNPNTHLTAAQLLACKNHQAAIYKIMSGIVTASQKQLDTMSLIATRVETFYANSGKKISSYDGLIADVSAKKTAAQNTIDLIKADSSLFSCDGTDPKGVAQDFKTNLAQGISALKDYKTSVKNLIVGVKSALGGDQ